MGYDNLNNYYKTNFVLMQHHKYSLSDLNEMIPWEKIVYVDLIKQHVKTQEEAIRLQKQTGKR